MRGKDVVLEHLELDKLVAVAENSRDRPTFAS